MEQIKPVLQCVTHGLKRHCVWVVKVPENASHEVREQIRKELEELSKVKAQSKGNKNINLSLF